jgi:glycosyltransferase involved in cell wall biosynthesis
MKKINIAIVITRLDLGGAQKIALYLAENLDKKKFNVHLIAGKGGYLDIEALKLTKKDVVVNLFNEIVHPINLFYDTIAIFKLRDYFIKNKIDIVHTHSSKAGIIGRKAAYLAGVRKIIHTVHGFPFHKYQNFFVHFIYVIIEKIFAFITDKLIAVGYDVMKYGLSKGVGNKEKYIVIRPGIEINLFKKQKVNKKEYLKKYDLNPKVFTIGMIGNCKKQKNPAGFIEIAKKVLNEITDVQFVFVGGGKDLIKYQKIIKNQNLSNKIKFIGWIDEPEKFLKSIDLFLLTSLWEGLPCTLVQAVCAGKLCVATDIDGNREFMQKIGLQDYLFPPFDYDKAKEIIIEIKNKRQKKPKTSILYEYDLKYTLNKYVEIYNNKVNKI